MQERDSGTETKRQRGRKESTFILFTGKFPEILTSLATDSKRMKWWLQTISLAWLRHAREIRHAPHQLEYTWEVGRLSLSLSIPLSSPLYLSLLLSLSLLKTLRLCRSCSQSCKIRVSSTAEIDARAVPSAFVGKSAAHC